MHGKRSVFVEIVRKHDGVHFMAKELVEIRVRAHIGESLPCVLKSFVPNVAKRDELHAYLRGYAGKAHPALHADDSDTNRTALAYLAHLLQHLLL
jgi:hypothetical protein